jgi:hypothetical protein
MLSETDSIRPLTESSQVESSLTHSDAAEADAQIHSIRLIQLDRACRNPMQSIILYSCKRCCFVKVVAWMTNFDKMVDLPLKHLSESDSIYLDCNRLLCS